MNKYRWYQALIVMIVVMWVLLSCEQGVEFTPDGYNASYTVRYHVYDDFEGVQAKFERLNKSEDGSNKKINQVLQARTGFSYNTSDGVCHIVIVRPDVLPRAEYEELLGHEHLHCMFGRWHGDSTSLPNRIKYDFDRVGIRSD